MNEIEQKYWQDIDNIYLECEFVSIDWIYWFPANKNNQVNNNIKTPTEIYARLEKEYREKQVSVVDIYAIYIKRACWQTRPESLSGFTCSCFMLFSACCRSDCTDSARVRTVVCMPSLESCDSVWSNTSRPLSSTSFTRSSIWSNSVSTLCNNRVTFRVHSYYLKAKHYLHVVHNIVVTDKYLSDIQ